MKKILGIGILAFLLIANVIFQDTHSVHALGAGCSNNHEFNEETVVHMNKSVAEEIKYHHWTVEYKDKFDQDMMKKSKIPNDLIEYPNYYISVETEFHIKLYDKDNQLLMERKIVVQPIKTYIDLYEEGDAILTGKTVSNADLQIESSDINGVSISLNSISDENGRFEFDYGGRFATLFSKRTEEYVTKSQQIYIERKFIDSNPPIITMASGTDNGVAIVIESDTLLKGMNLEFYDKNRKLIERNTSSSFEPKYSILGYKKNEENTFFTDGIKYVRYRAFNLNGCKSTWAEMELVDDSPPKFGIDPWMEGDIYLTGISDPGSRIEWKQNPYSKEELGGSLVVPKSGLFKIKLPLSIKTSPPLIEFSDEVGNVASETVYPVTRIDKFVVMENWKDGIFALSDIISGTSNYGKDYTIEFDGRRWPGVFGGAHISLDGGDDSFDFSKLPYEIKYTLYNADGSVKYSLRQMIAKTEKPALLQNISYDLDKQEIYADSNLFYIATIWNQKSGWRHSSYAKTKRVILPLSDKKKIVKVGDKVTLYSTLPYTSGIGQEVVIKQNKKLNTPVVNDITTKSKYIEGSTYPHIKVLLKSGKKNYEVQSDSKGKFKIKILSLTGGSEVSISAVDRLNQSTPIVKKKVLRLFTTFTISKVKSGSTGLKGTGHSGSDIKAYKKSKIISKGTVDKKGNYSLKVAKLKKNDTLLLKMSKSGYQTMTKTVRVN